MMMDDRTGLFWRWRRFAQGRVAPPAVAPQAAPRSPGLILDGCEYEIRQMRREVVNSRRERLAGPVPAAPARPAEPFVLGGRLRDEEFRARLAPTGAPPSGTD
jgi:hypothetical protein